MLFKKRKDYFKYLQTIFGFNEANHQNGENLGTNYTSGTDDERTM